MLHIRVMRLGQLEMGKGTWPYDRSGDSPNKFGEPLNILNVLIAPKNTAGQHMDSSYGMYFLSTPT